MHPFDYTSPKTIHKIHKKMFFELWLIHQIFDNIPYPNLSNSLRALHLRYTLPFSQQCLHYHDFISQFYHYYHKRTPSLHYFTHKTIYKQMFLEYWLIQKFFSVYTTSLLHSFQIHTLTINKHSLLTALHLRFYLSSYDKFRYYFTFENSYKIHAIQQKKLRSEA